MNLKTEMNDEDYRLLCDRLKEQSHTTGLEIIKHFQRLMHAPQNEQTAWDAIHFAGAALAALRHPTFAGYPPAAEEGEREQV